MMKPKAKLIASRSASVTAGTALPARVNVAITEPGPTRTSAAVPKASANARCRIENIVANPLNCSDCCSTLSNALRKLIAAGGFCQEKSTVGLAPTDRRGFGDQNHAHQPPDGLAFHQRCVPGARLRSRLAGEVPRFSARR